MPLITVPIYKTRNLAAEIDSGARTILPGTNISFTTNADGSITINNTGGAGTVTSVGASGSTGLTIGGTNPVTTSGTITFTLSANLQAWSGVTVASKANLASPAFTGVPTAPTAAPGTNTTQLATTAFVQAAAGNYVLKTGDTMSGGLSFGSATAANDSDVTRHVALFGTTYGFGITSSRLNYNSGAGAGHYFRIGGTDAVEVTTANTATTLVTNGAVRTLGTVAALYFQNRSAADIWAWYNTANIARLHNGAGDVVTVTSAGNLAAAGTVSDSIGELRNVPQVISNASANFALSDAGKHKIKNNSTAYTYTIATNATVAFPVGTAITVANPGNTTNNITIAVAGGVTLYRNGTLGGFTVAPGFMVTLLKIGTDHWMA